MDGIIWTWLLLLLFLSAIVGIEIISSHDTKKRRTRRELFRSSPQFKIVENRYADGSKSFFILEKEFWMRRETLYRPTINLPQSRFEKLEDAEQFLAAHVVIEQIEIPVHV